VVETVPVKPPAGTALQASIMSSIISAGPSPAAIEGVGRIV
jgi:hypothetical protein